LAALSEAEPEFRSQPDPRGACLAAELPALQGREEGSLGEERSYLCIRRGNLVVLRSRETSESQVLELPTAPLELFWASEHELGYGYLQGIIGGVRLLDVSTGEERDLAARWRETLATLPSRTLRVPEEYPTLQGAIDAARPRDAVQIAPGVYSEDLIIAKDLRLEGADGVEIRGNIRMIAPTPRTVTLRRLRILAGRGDGLDVRGPVRLTLEEVSIVGAKGNGLSLQGGTRSLTLRDVQILSNEGCGVWVDAEGAQVNVEGALEMEGNGVDLCGYAPISLRRPLVPQTDRPLVRVPEDYESVQEAVDAVAPGGVVELGPERYRGGVTLWKPLTLRGAGWGRTKLQGTGRLTISVPAGVEGVRLEGLTLRGGLGIRDGLWAYGGVTLEGVRVQAARGTGIVARGRARLAVRSTQFVPVEVGIQAEDRAEVELYGVRILGTARPPFGFSFGTGIELAGDARLSAQDLEVRHLSRGIRLCAFDPECTAALRLTGARLERNGVVLDLGGKAEAVVQNATLRRNEGLLEGIRLGDRAQLTLEDVEIVDGFGPALHTDLTSFRAQLVLRRVRISGHEVGLRLQGSVEALIEDSQIWENRTDGLEVEAPGETVFGDWAARIRLERSEIRDNGTDPSCARLRELCVGLELRGAADVEIRASRITGNADWGLAAYLTRCGYPEDDFRGRVRISEDSLVQGNNAAGNHSGEICLP
jgi:nitrous oxidase accessory protein NosD